MPKKISPYVVIILAFLACVLTGSLLLFLPFSSEREGWLPYIDSLFLATSAVCVTGLSPLDIGTALTPFGQIVMAILIEIGGLSVLTIACFIFTFVQKQLDLNTKALMKEALNRESMEDIKTLIRKIVIFSFSVQIVGAGLNFAILYPYFKDVGKTLSQSIFLAISAFNNAGFDILGNGDSLITVTQNAPFWTNFWLKLNLMSLITIGGIGYIFIEEIMRKRSWRRLNTTTKIVLIISASLLFGGGVLLKIFTAAAGKDVPLLECFFLSVSARTAGFDSVGLSDLPAGAYSLLLFLMYIGASPCSTGGGVKTTTLFVIVAVIVAFIRGKTPAFNYRKISSSTILKAFILLLFTFVYLFILVSLLTVSDGQLPMRELIFEAVSALSTTGLSMGITAVISGLGKFFLCITMFIGRVGVLSFLNIINKSWIFSSLEENVKYLEENIIIG